MTIIAALKEHAADENRVAITPEVAKKLKGLGFAVIIETGAGLPALYPDTLYKDAGAEIALSAEDAAKRADVIVTLQPAAIPALAQAKSSAFVIGLVNPYQNKDFLQKSATQGVTAIAMELVPRITRAQAMDVLSSQANLAGYKAVLEAAALYQRGMPMMMTAAGTVAAARVFVMGAGVAGLQAIATARRLGAIVSATDVRLAAKEQVQSLGATFVMVEDEETKAAETSGGYAKEMSDAYKTKQAQLIADTIAKQDIVITTALIPGRPAPKLVTAQMIATMKPGSVIVDLAAEQGGNCELTEPGKVAEKNNVTIVGHRNMAARIASDASSLYARNVLNLLQLMQNKETKEVSLNLEDEIIKAVTLTHNGTIVNDKFAN
ncbi:MAG: Re/Si-specific NAD(P)(+) transhydrogenase subunit alpha [Alphaproteobacteria bacterium]|nr:Re/Si-specific NAD(P)(+) transhydrogenase subunit alpha [Alphaproteobacteria bacterium]